MNENFKNKINTSESSQQNPENKELLNNFIDNYWNSSILIAAIDKDISHRENEDSINRKITEKLSQFEKHFNYEENKHDLSEIISILDEFPFEFSWTRDDLQKKVMLIILKKYENIDNPVEKLKKIKFNKEIVNELSSDQNGHQSPAIQKLINDYTSKIENDNPELPLN